MLPLDTHAHLEPNIAPLELDRLGACVIAVTRSQLEYEQVARRADPAVVWGVGCHPGLAKAIQSFSRDRFRSAIIRAAVVAEVGLDGASKVPMDSQRDVFDQIVGVVVEVPRVISVHSYRATGLVLDTLEGYRAGGVILHWWLGDEDETTRAVKLGAYFSVNAAQVTKWKALHLIPNDRLLIETDHPFGDRRETAPRRPGNVLLPERRLAEHLGVSPEEVRRLTWQNFARLVDELNIHELLPHQFQVQLLAS